MINNSKIYNSTLELMIMSYHSTLWTASSLPVPNGKGAMTMSEGDISWLPTYSNTVENNFNNIF